MVLLQTQLDTSTINFESGAIDAKKRSILRACGGGGSNNTEYPGEQGELCWRQKPVFGRSHTGHFGNSVHFACKSGFPDLIGLWRN